MRGLSLLDILIILIVLGLLLVAGSRDFTRYEGRALSPPPTATVPSSN